MMRLVDYNTLVDKWYNGWWVAWGIMTVICFVGYVMGRLALASIEVAK